MMSQLEQRVELCLRGTSAQHTAGFNMWLFHTCDLLSYVVYSSESSQLIHLIFLPLGTLLMFDGWNGNKTATCLLAWQLTMTPNLHADAMSGQTMPLAGLLIFDALN